MRDIEQIIREKKQNKQLSKGQLRIADAVLFNAKTVAYMTASQLAKFVKISESTVVRFAKHLGYNGYAEFSHAVQKFVLQSLTPNQRIDISNQRNGNTDKISAVAKNDIEKISETMTKLDRTSFDNACESILDPKTRRIFVIGVRSAEPLALILKYNLSLIFDNIRLVSPYSTAEILEQLISLDERDLLIAFSFPRYSTKVLTAVKFAKDRGTKVISITDSQESPLAKYTDHLLIAQTGISSFMDSLVAPISIINAIIAEITEKREMLVRAKFDRLEKIWDEYKVYTYK